MAKSQKRRPAVTLVPAQQKPALANTPKITRIPAHAQNPDSYRDKKIGWRFTRMDSGGKGKCSLKHLHDYIDRVCFYEKRTRREIENTPHCHPCAVEKLSKVAQERIRTLNLDETTLFQLDFNTPCRLWGVWDENIFDVIWLDREHDFYVCR